LPLVETHDSRVTTATFFLGWRDFVEENFHSVFLMKPGNRQATIVQRAVFAECNHFFSN
jgi:hypothetical protein